MKSPSIGTACTASASKSAGAACSAVANAHAVFEMARPPPSPSIGRPPQHGERVEELRRLLRRRKRPRRVREVLRVHLRASRAAPPPRPPRTAPPRRVRAARPSRRRAGCWKLDARRTTAACQSCVPRGPARCRHGAGRGSRDRGGSTGPSLKVVDALALGPPKYAEELVGEARRLDLLVERRASGDGPRVAEGAAACGRRAPKFEAAAGGARAPGGRRRGGGGAASRDALGSHLSARLSAAAPLRVPAQCSAAELLEPMQLLVHSPDVGREQSRCDLPCECTDRYKTYDDAACTTRYWKGDSAPGARGRGVGQAAGNAIMQLGYSEA